MLGRGQGAPDATDPVANGAFDPDVPTPAVGSPPSIDLGAVGLPRLGWLFVAGAVYVGVVWLARATEISVASVTDAVWVAVALSYAVTAAGTVLLPAALLLRAPDAARTHPLLLVGLAGGALAVILRTLISAASSVAPEAITWVTWVDGTIVELIQIAGMVLVGLGLLRLLPARPGGRWLLVAIAAAYLSLAYVPLAITLTQVDDPATLDPLTMVLLGGSLLALAFASWVAAVGWLDRHDPRRFWALLAAAVPLTLAAQLMTATTTLLSLGWSPGLALGTGLCVTATVVLALVAYVRYVPVTTAVTDRRMAIPFRWLTRS